MKNILKITLLDKAKLVTFIYIWDKKNCLLIFEIRWNNIDENMYFFFLTRGGVDWSCKHKISYLMAISYIDKRCRMGHNYQSHHSKDKRINGFI